MGVIGPHEGKELKLMLQNRKNIALFYTDCGIPNAFMPYLEKGIFRLKKLTVRNDDNKTIRYYIIYKPSYKNEACRLATLLEKASHHFNLEVEREIGQLLGYLEEDITFYLQHCLSHFNIHAIPH